MTARCKYRCKIYQGVSLVLAFGLKKNWLIDWLVHWLLLGHKCSVSAWQNLNKKSFSLQHMERFRECQMKTLEKSQVRLLTTRCVLQHVHCEIMDFPTAWQEENITLSMMSRKDMLLSSVAHFLHWTFAPFLVKVSFCKGTKKLPAFYVARCVPESWEWVYEVWRYEARKQRDNKYFSPLKKLRFLCVTLTGIKLPRQFFLKFALCAFLLSWSSITLDLQIFLFLKLPCILSATCNVSFSVCGTVCRSERQALWEQSLPPLPQLKYQIRSGPVWCCDVCWCKPCGLDDTSWCTEFAGCGAQCTCIVCGLPSPVRSRWWNWSTGRGPPDHSCTGKGWNWNLPFLNIVTRWAALC